MFKATPRPLYAGGRDPVPLVQEAGWAPGPGWTGAENLDPPGFDPRTAQRVASRIMKRKTMKMMMMTTMMMMMMIMMMMMMMMIIII
jgi:hypothetical protein